MLREVDFPAGTSKITAGEFQEDLLGEDKQVKEAEAKFTQKILTNTSK